MKKALFLSIPIVIAIALVGVWLFSGLRQPPAWRSELNNYLAVQNSSTLQLAVVSTAHANQPWNYTPDMSQATYSSSDVAYSDYADNLWCVLLRYNSSEGTSPGSGYTLIFVALRTDLYNSDWAVHETGILSSDPKFADVLSKVGCQLKQP